MFDAKRFKEIKREFSFLITEYAFRYDSQFRYGTGPFFEVTWTNGRTKVEVCCNEDKENPVWIRVFEADSLWGLEHAKEYRNEFSTPADTVSDCLHNAAKWIKENIAMIIPEVDYRGMEDEEINRIENRIKALRKEYVSLGIFKKKRKQSINEEINLLLSELNKRNG